MLILSQNQTSIDEEYFPCCRFSYQHGFVDKKHVQRGPRHKKSRCPWDGVYLRTSIMFQTGGKPSTWFPPVGLVELYFPSNSTLHKFNSITKILINFHGWLMITMMIMMMMTTIRMTIMMMRMMMMTMMMMMRMGVMMVMMMIMLMMTLPQTLIEGLPLSNLVFES